ncbi:MAG: hypothetical protein GXP13_06185 [Gammaproteobacteria bacterium]|nr:hypothetical protein [Gammaproteobacteria bacterium]
MKVVNIRTFDTIIDANISMGRLKAEGIDCWLADEHIIQLDMLYIPAIGGIKLQVSPEVADKATAILDTDYSDLELDDKDWQ